MYRQIRAMTGRGVPTAPADLVVGDVVRVDGIKYRVQAPPEVTETGTVVEVYNEDNQTDRLYLGSATVRVIGTLPTSGAGQ